MIRISSLFLFVLPLNAQVSPSTTEDHGRELWKTDGTFAGTSLVKDIFPGEGDGDPKMITEVGDFVFFLAKDESSGTELWKSDGTDAGTIRVKDIAPGPADSDLREFSAIGPILIFVVRGPEAGSRIWRSDGTEAGTYPLQDARITRLRYLVQTDHLVYFAAPHPEAGLQLWLTDGTLDGTRPLTADENGGIEHEDLDPTHSTLFYRIAR